MKRKRARPNYHSPNPLLLDRRQVAEFLGFRSPSTADKWAAEYPDFPVPMRRHPGGHPRWYRVQIEQWRAKHFPSPNLEENGL